MLWTLKGEGFCTKLDNFMLMQYYSKMAACNTNIDGIRKRLKLVHANPVLWGRDKNKRKNDRKKEGGEQQGQRK